MLISNWQPEANICSAISTANGAPIARPTRPNVCPSMSMLYMSVWEQAQNGLRRIRPAAISARTMSPLGSSTQTRGTEPSAMFLWRRDSRSSFSG